MAQENFLSITFSQFLQLCESLTKFDRTKSHKGAQPQEFQGLRMSKATPDSYQLQPESAEIPNINLIHKLLPYPQLPAL